MNTYQINYTNVKDEPVTVFLNSNENLVEVKKKFLRENKDVEEIDSCVNMGKELTREEMKKRADEFHRIRDMKDWLNIYFNRETSK